jgi:hypothetical protein
MSLTELETTEQTCPCGKVTSLGRFIYCDSCKHFHCPDCMEEARALGGGEDVNGTGINLCGPCIDSGKGLKLIFPKAGAFAVRTYTMRVALPGEEPMDEITVRSDYLLTGLVAASISLQLTLARRGYFGDKSIEIIVHCGRRLIEKRYSTINNLSYDLATMIEHDAAKWPVLLGL